MRKRSKYELKNSGNYELIYPSEEFKEEEFQKYLDSAQDIQEEFNNGGQVAKRRMAAD